MERSSVQIINYLTWKVVLLLCQDVVFDITQSITKHFVIIISASVHPDHMMSREDVKIGVLS